MSRPDSTTLVATTAEVPDIILGFATAEKGFQRPCLHYLYVKPAYRKMGVAKELTHGIGIPSDGSPWFYTFKTDYLSRNEGRFERKGIIHAANLARRKKSSPEKAHHHGRYPHRGSGDKEGIPPRQGREP